MQINLHEDEVFIVFKALHWYKDRIKNRSEQFRDWAEEDNLDWLQDKLKDQLKKELFID